MARHQGRRLDFFFAQLLQLLPAELVGCQVAVAGQAIDAVQFVVFVKALLPQKPLQLGLAHLLDINETKMLSNQFHNRAKLLIRHAETSAHPCSQIGPDLGMAVKADPITNRIGQRLADVVEEHSQSQCLGWIAHQTEHQACVDPDVSFGMEFRWLLHPDHRGHFGKDHYQQSRFQEQAKPPIGMLRCQHFQRM